MSTVTFKRPNLAKAYCDSLEGKGISDSTSGLFLAGPRRVGKSTFLKEDLIPEAISRQWLTVYVDLWEDKATDPSMLIIEAIKSAIKSNKGAFKKLAEKIKPQRITVLQTVEFDLNKPGLPENVTIVDILKHLIKISGKRVLLIVDEAQHALTSEKGLNAMFSIKSARDQINISHDVPELMLAFTGSNRDKLAQLVIKKDQPFFGSEVISFPLLGKEYSDFYTERVNLSLSDQNKFSTDSMWEAFELTGHRPEVLKRLVSNVALNNEASSFSTILADQAQVWHDEIWREFEDEYNKLPALQQALIACLVENDRAWSPFSEASIAFYEQYPGVGPVSTSTVQKAIKALRENGFIWQSNRGIYALEDENFTKWFKASK